LTEGSWVVTHVEGLKEFEDDDFDWGWRPGENDTAVDLDGDTNTKVSSIYWAETGGDYEVSGTWEIYAFDGDHYAYNTEWDFLDSKVTWDGTKYYFVDDFKQTAASQASQNTPDNPGSPGPDSPSNGGSSRLHDSWINGGKGNDIILAGQGRDEITGGQGDDFIDGGSESEFLSKFVGATA
ncbi:MAG: hypothetical protein GY918_11230, partial [Gammaproteobacteria bacterium]|nr:hypothetical protein [Gammaproteobacteria bacterium]